MSLTSKVPGELRLSFFPRADTCHADEAFFGVTSQLLPHSAAGLGVWGWAHPHGTVFLELLPSVGPYEPMPTGGGWAGPSGPLGTIFGILSS